MELDNEALTARIVVLEMLLAGVIIELSRHGTRDVESVRRIMRPVEIQLAALGRDAPEGNSRLVEQAREYFADLSGVLVGMLPHQGNH